MRRPRTVSGPGISRVVQPARQYAFLEAARPGSGTLPIRRLWKARRDALEEVTQYLADVFQRLASAEQGKGHQDPEHLPPDVSHLELSLVFPVSLHSPV